MAACEKQVAIYPAPNAGAPIVYLPVVAGMGDDVLQCCCDLGCLPFTLVAIGELDWNRELSPWPCDAITATSEYLDENLPQGALDVAYLSLGKKEHKTPNRMMREVLTDTKRCEQTLQDRGAKTLFERNPGNHFSEPALRSARGIAWMLAQ